MPPKPCDLLLRWYDHNRRDLPWRQTSDPYRVWLSEIMLQQTRVETVKGYYARFLSRFADVHALCDAPQQDVLKLWEGLGYYSRARNLHAAAKVVSRELGGQFPRRYSELLKLPGVGEYTAGAIASIAFGERVPAIDGNVYRVATRFFGVREDIGRPEVKRRLRALVTDLLPAKRAGDCNQALMELGATLCVPGAPACERCPLCAQCDAYTAGDADALPMREAKRPPTSVAVMVCLLFWERKVLVMRRNERMLQGMYVFALVENEAAPDGAMKQLAEMGLSCTFAEALGHARHVFTHRVWEMEILRYQLLREPSDTLLRTLDARLVDAEGLRELPVPAAVRVARDAALQVMEG